MKEILYTGRDYWKNYMHHWFGKELIARWEDIVETTLIDSVSGKINLEVYKNTDTNSPTLVFSHGIAGYARVLLPFLVPLFDKGFNIVAPDLEGYGYNNRLKGDFTWDIHLQNLKDSVDYAKRTFNGSVFLGGGSMGGPLAYATDARYNCADGLICWCLWDFADREFMARETNTGRMTYPLMPFMRLFSSVAGKMRLKTTAFVSYDTLTDSTEFNSMIKADPQAGTLISLRGACSLVTQSKPDLGHEHYEKPVLVCQPESDKMTPARYTKKVFSKLKSNQKKYVGFEGPHFPVSKQTYEKWAETVKHFVDNL
jgi:pimeloyl-ACP methyl ester carboxylesterase